MHVRWELYPVAHEGKRAHYGGSYLEESEWWKKKREVSLWGELKVMVPEIVFLVALKEHNSRLWSRSFPFHFGLYLVGACTALMMLSGLLGLVASTVLRCNDCIDYHLIRCVRTGYSDEEIHDALNVALVVGGSIAIPHLRHAFETLEFLRREDAGRQA